MDIPGLYELFLRHGKISTDTRRIEPGSIFFALKGENFDGSDFIQEALSKGAAWAVTQSVTFNDNRVIRVDNALTALQQLATYHRVTSGIKILAITGSNGKTTTKELCKAVLSRKFKVYATEGNLNNHIGVPLTILTMLDSSAVGIVEMGANHPGEIDFLCRIARPDYGLITNIGKAHLEGFGSIEGVAGAKGELFDYLQENNGTILINEGNTYIEKLVSSNYSKALRYNGTGAIRSLDIKPALFLEFNALLEGRTVEVKTGLTGRYNIENVLAACAAGILFGVSTHDILDAIAGYKPAGHRSQFIDTGRNHVIMDSYNANPSSMNAALKEFINLDQNDKTAILGEMAEVGTSTADEHEAVLAMLKEGDPGIEVICIGGAFRMPAAKAGLKHFSNTDELTGYLHANPIVGRLILVKGSRVNRLEKLLECL